MKQAKGRKKLIAGIVLSAVLIEIIIFVVLSIRLTLSPQEILRNIKQIPDGNIVAEVVERDAEAGEIHMVFYYEANGDPALAIFRPRWTGYEFWNSETTEDWRCSLWSKEQGIGRYIAWGVCEEDVAKVWLDDPVNQYAKLFSTGDRHFWYALTDTVVSSNEDVVLIP